MKVPDTSESCAELPEALRVSVILFVLYGLKNKFLSLSLLSALSRRSRSPHLKEQSLIMYAKDANNECKFMEQLSVTSL